MTGQTFIFCIGATKAGTSWLFDYLYGHRDCHFPALKELHYFDALESGNGGWYHKQAVEMLDRTKAEIAAADGQHPMTWRKQLVSDLERWLQVFDGKTQSDTAYLDYLRTGGDTAQVIGDFTPSYGLLSKKTFARMAKITDKVRFIYLLRDPVERIWSNIRMVAGGQGRAVLDAKVDAVLKGTAVNILDRSNYRRTLNRLSSVIPRDALHIEFFERLFTPDAIERLCAFLGIMPQPATFDRVVHQSVKAELPDARRAQLQTALRPQYNFVERFMGELPSDWTKNMVSA